MPPAKDRGPRGLAERPRGLAEHQGPFETAPESRARLPDSLEATPRARARRQRTELRCRTMADGMSPTNQAPGCTRSTRDPDVDKNAAGCPVPWGHGERKKAWKTYCPARGHPAHEAWCETVAPSSSALHRTSRPRVGEPGIPDGAGQPAAADRPMVCPPPARHQVGDRQATGNTKTTRCPIAAPVQPFSNHWPWENPAC